MSTPIPPDKTPGSLYVLATPIGNLGDISHRAIETLRNANLILCEDTRQTRKLLDHYGISVPTMSYHDHNEARKTPEIVERLTQGATIALVSDAGTPTISDPGYRLLNALRDTDISVIPIPGASAVTALLSVSGLPTDRFVFEGFLPVKKGKRRRRLEELATDERTMILFESPYRIARTLSECLAAMGNRPACVGRELTKTFEEIQRGTLEQLGQWAEKKTIKGEITVAIGGRSTTIGE
ncbi:MAG: 16S rRNA (cytidine(1402)-2'-O)-methyltransferase [candidate division Zixibacteria bacterium]|nr:16S rRNA (cytidine(1402)-2'-O)-methyltransferase [candidate division Zixibacteria bacterium]